MKSRALNPELKTLRKYWVQGIAPLLIFVLALLARPNLLHAQRLPSYAIPTHYQVSIDADIAGQSFTGEETIEVVLREPNKEVVINSVELKIALAEITAGARTQPAQVIYDKPNETVRLTAQDSVPAGTARLHLKYSGKLTAGLRGLYLSKGARRAYAVTQFEGTYARMMFPCFDEPGFKATFDLAVVADKADTAISNGRIIRDEPVPGTNRHRLTFSTSPKMSTYLVALAIGDWECLERTTDGVPIRVCIDLQSQVAFSEK